MVRLQRNPDVLAELVAERTGAAPLLVGFAAETGDASGSVLEHGRAKLARKGCDLLVLNEVGETKGFATPTNAVTILGADGSERVVPEAAKDVVADVVWDAVVPMLAPARPAPTPAPPPETGAP